MENDKIFDILHASIRLHELLKVRNFAKVQAISGFPFDKQTWLLVYEMAKENIKQQERYLADHMPSETFQRMLDLRKP